MERHRCRLCFNHVDGGLTLRASEDQTTEIINMVEYVAGFEIMPKPMWPKMVCFACLDQLYNFQAFKKRCIESNEILHSGMWDAEKESSNEQACDSETPMCKLSVKSEFSLNETVCKVKIEPIDTDVVERLKSDSPQHTLKCSEEDIKERLQTTSNLLDDSMEDVPLAELLKTEPLSPQGCEEDDPLSESVNPYLSSYSQQEDVALVNNLNSDPTFLNSAKSEPEDTDWTPPSKRKRQKKRGRPRKTQIPKARSPEIFNITKRRYRCSEKPTIEYLTPHPCAHCNLSFVDKSDLICHQAIMHKGMGASTARKTRIGVFTCVYCCTIFNTADKLNNHICSDILPEANVHSENIHAGNHFMRS